MKKWLAWLAAGLYLFIAAVAWAQPQVPPAPTHSIYIQDYADVVSSATEQRINDLGSRLAAKTKAQIVVVTVKTLGDSTPDEYGLAVLRQWGVGDKELNNGVVMLVAVDDHKSRIEVGYGLEGALPDAKTGRLQDEYMLPFFRQNDYDRGILNGYVALTQVVAAEYGAEIATGGQTAKPAPAQQGSWFDTLPWWMKAVGVAMVIGVLVFDWVFLGGNITWLLLSLLRFRGGGGGGPGGRGGFGGGSGGGGGSNRQW
ncbi:hypothetical protein P22_0443 [Propionispora sp. 2/2-37]|uniref:TPM domain-containing protein n=1 Tax=Propionispora sp. 2/2-37 TaxID=1677858 RepID=UPI0006BB69E7|nr:TPM domain-containing protein [Propionispora sp. 2/2-37]CUH94377.1 hypothetical protein P22_0443 [Propionispora sp. 2/2-37]